MPIRLISNRAKIGRNNTQDKMPYPAAFNGFFSKPFIIYRLWYPLTP